MKKLLLTVVSVVFCAATMVFFAYFVYLFFLGLSSGLTDHFDNYFGRMGGYGQLFFDILICLINLVIFIIAFLRGLVKKLPVYKIVAHFGLLNISFVAFFYIIEWASRLILGKTGSILTFYGCLGFFAVMWYLQMSLQCAASLFKEKENPIEYKG